MRDSLRRSAREAAGDGAIHVVNGCRKGRLDGKSKIAKGKATVADLATTSSRS